MRLQSAAVFVIAVVPVMAAAQQFLPNFGPPVDPNTRFEVVAIKAFDQAISGQVLMRTTPGRFESSLSVGLLVRQALQKSDYQIVGAPGWMDTQRYSITAKPPEGATPGAASAMLLNLLRDRFQLATHVETREQPIYHLVLARADGRLGPDLEPTSAECQATLAERIAAAQTAVSGRGGSPPLPTLPGPNDPPPCGFVRSLPGLVAASGRAIAEFARGTLSDLTGRPVIDKTGLTGLYDFTLKYTPDGRTAGPFALIVGPSPGAPSAPVDPDVPSLFVALQEQLGLKLENARGPVEVVVIDKLEKPTLD